MQTETPAPAESSAGQVISKPTTFKDTKGNEWRVVFKSSTIERIKFAHGVDFWEAFDLSEKGPLTRIGSNERLQIAVTWELVEPQAEQIAISKEDFGDLFDGRVFDEGFEAIQGGLLVFFSGARASLFRKTLAQLAWQQEKQVKLVSDLYEISAEEEAKLSSTTKEKWRTALQNEYPAQASKAIKAAIEKSRAASST